MASRLSLRLALLASGSAAVAFCALPSISTNLTPVPLATVSSTLSASPDSRHGGACVAALPLPESVLISALQSACVQDSMALPRPSAVFAESSIGRWHCVEKRIDPASLASFLAIETAILPVVSEFFSSRPFFRSELQLVNAAPGCDSQFFHQDNSRRGLTICIPLVAVTQEMGPTELLCGTHSLTSPIATTLPAPTSLSARLGAAFANVEAAQPTFAPGSALFFDSRCLHRGLPNTSNSMRPVLIFRYDLYASPPPGHTPLTTALCRPLGRALHAWSRLKLQWRKQ